MTKKCPAFVEFEEDSLPTSEMPVIGNYTEPAESRSRPNIQFLNFIIILSALIPGT
jgi:hypothetical protein